MLTGIRLIAAAIALLAMPSGLIAQEDDGAVWSTGQFTSSESGRTEASLTYGIPETDAVAFSAGCSAGQPTVIKVMLFVDFGDRPDMAPVIATFTSEGFSATYPAVVRNLSSEFAGVEVELTVNDPLWLIMTSGEHLSFHSIEPASVTVPLADATAPVESFLDACRTEVAAVSGDATGDIRSQTYTCDDGSRMTATFDNSNAYSVALVTHDAMKNDVVSENVPLIETVSGSGALYSNGDYSLHTKADEALLTRGETTFRCEED